MLANKKAAFYISDIAKMVLEKCRKSTNNPHQVDYEVTYSYELVEDTYSNWGPGEN